MPKVKNQRTDLQIAARPERQVHERIELLWLGDSGESLLRGDHSDCLPEVRGRLEACNRVWHGHRLPVQPAELFLPVPRLVRLVQSAKPLPPA